FFFFSSRRRHTRFSRDWSSVVCSSDLDPEQQARLLAGVGDPFLAEVGGEPDQCAVQVTGRAEVGPCLAVPQVGDDLGEPRHAASPAYCPTYAKSFSW